MGSVAGRGGREEGREKEKRGRGNKRKRGKEEEGGREGERVRLRDERGGRGKVCVRGEVHRRVRERVGKGNENGGRGCDMVRVNGDRDGARVFVGFRERRRRTCDWFVGGWESVVHERPCLGACSRGSVRRSVRGRRGRQSGHGNKRFVLHAHAHAHTTGQSATPTSRGVRGLRLHRREDRCRAPDHP